MKRKPPLPQLAGCFGKEMTCVMSASMISCVCPFVGLRAITRKWSLERLTFSKEYSFAQSRWTPVCWEASACWIQPPSCAALRPTRFPQCSRHLPAPRTTWSWPALSGPPTVMSSWWRMMARSTASWFKGFLGETASTWSFGVFAVRPRRKSSSGLSKFYFQNYVDWRLRLKA